MEVKDQGIWLHKVVHKAGKGNTNVDALNRNPIPDDQHVQISSKDEEKEEEARKYTEEKKRQILYEYHDAPVGGYQGHRTL